MKRSEMNGQATSSQKMSGGWLLAVVCLLFASSCRAPAPQAGRYQWTIVSHDDKPDDLYVFNTENGEVAEFNTRSNKWVSSVMTKPLPDWNDIRKQREAREKRKALPKSFSQMPLAKQVAWADKIQVNKYFGERTECVELLKGVANIYAIPSRRPYKATDDGLVVWFEGMAEGEYLQFGLSHTPVKVYAVFLAPETIIDDVKAEIKRQEEKQKEAHAENH